MKEYLFHIFFTLFFSVLVHWIGLDLKGTLVS